MSLFFIVSATTAIYTLSLHDALPICLEVPDLCHFGTIAESPGLPLDDGQEFLGIDEPALCSVDNRPVALSEDRKSTRLNSSHSSISYAVFCLKKKKGERPLFERKPRS